MPTANKDIEALRNDLEALKKQFKSMSHDGGNLLDSARSQLEAKAEELMESIKSAGASALEQGGEVIHKAEEKIAEKPFSSVLVTLGLGVVIGWMLRRKMS